MTPKSLNLTESTLTELKKTLITTDGKGKKVKESALAEIVRRVAETAEGRRSSLTNRG